MNNWLTVSINPPPLDKPIIARDRDSGFGYAHNYTTFNFDSNVMDINCVMGTLINSGCVEWKFIEDKDAEEFYNEQ